MESICFILVICSFPLISFHSNPFDNKIEIKAWQYHAAAFGTALAWFINLIMIGKIPRLGLYIQMAATVTLSFLKFGLAFLSLLLSFALSFTIVFPREPAFSNSNFILAQIMKVIVMMSGELEYNNLIYRQSQNIELERHKINGEDGKKEVIFNGTMSVNTETDNLMFPFTGHLLLGGFVFFVTIILMNLLVGIAIADVQEIHELSHLHLMIQQIKTISLLDNTFMHIARNYPTLFPGFHEIKGIYCLDLEGKYETVFGSMEGCIYKVSSANTIHEGNENGAPMDQKLNGTWQADKDGKPSENQKVGKKYFLPARLKVTQVAKFIRR